MKTVYCSGIWDLLHASHINALQKAANMGEHLIVGVGTDEDAMTYKRKPIQSYAERVAAIASLPFVHKVVTAPMFPEAGFYDMYGIDLHVQDKDDNSDLDYYRHAKALGKIQFIGRDPAASTSGVIKAVADTARIDILGGMTNENILVTIADQRFVFKNLDQNVGNSRKLADTLDRLATCGINTLNHTWKGDYLRLDYLPSRHYDKVEPMPDKLLREVRKLHNCGASLPRTFEQVATKCGYEFSDTRDTELIASSDTIVPIHLDLIPENILVNDKMDITLIDWDYTCRGPIELDYATLLMEGLITVEDIQKELLDIRRVVEFGLLLLRVWTSWCTKKSYSPSNDYYLELQAKQLKLNDIKKEL